MIERYPTLEFVYNAAIRPVLPQKTSVYNGVALENGARLLDREYNNPGYKEVNVGELRKSVQTGEKVVVVGGGHGVTSVVAARHVGESGEVTTYEGSEEKVEEVRRTLSLNQMEERCDVRHVVVGQVSNLAGSMGDANVIDPSEIEDCDVLEMDCEGGEMDIIPKLTVRPRRIIVETHPQFDSETEDVVSLLHNQGYELLRKEPNPNGPGHILTAEEG